MTIISLNYAVFRKCKVYYDGGKTRHFVADTVLEERTNHIVRQSYTILSFIGMTMYHVFAYC